MNSTGHIGLPYKLQSIQLCKRSQDKLDIFTSSEGFEKDIQKLTCILNAYFDMTEKHREGMYFLIVGNCLNQEFLALYRVNWNLGKFTPERIFSAAHIGFKKDLLEQEKEIIL